MHCPISSSFKSYGRILFSGLSRLRTREELKKFCNVRVSVSVLCLLAVTTLCSVWHDKGKPMHSSECRIVFLLSVQYVHLAASHLFGACSVSRIV